MSIRKVCLWSLRKGEVGNHSLDNSNLSGLDILPHSNAKGKEPRPDSLHKEELLLLSQLGKYLSLLSVHCEWLLTHDMLPSSECLQGVGEMV